MLEEDIDDTHLCIKCSSTIVGLENYVQHRKTNCAAKSARDIVQIDHSYDGNYDFPEPNTYPIKNAEVEKENKSLTDCYDLPYDLGADLFFSSLQLQSSSKRTLTAPAVIPPGGKTSTGKMMTRKATAALLSTHENDEEWIEQENNSDSLMKAVRDISGHKKYDSTFKMISFQHDSPELSEEENEEDEDFEGVSPDHTGGKWKPENSSAIRLRGSPAWNERLQWDIQDHNDDKGSKVEEQDDFDHDLNPPPGYTKGKWIPGTKVSKLDYKEDVEIEKIYSHQYWCNNCNRKLASKAMYEKHLKSNLHLKRVAPEQHLEKVTVSEIKLSERVKKPSIYLNPEIYIQNIQEQNSAKQKSTSKKKRRKYFTKCETCNARPAKYLMGKHLISHYHYRHMVLNPSKSFQTILENIHKIVLQAPFQCQCCRFYFNTHEDFMNHWNSDEHRNVTEGPGKFWCSFCKFECEDNNQMCRHLLSAEHKEVILAINKSVPIRIGKKVIIECPKCKQSFQYNIELRKHASVCSSEPMGTASNEYQTRFDCKECDLIFKSRISLQRHDVMKHRRKKYICSVCQIDFDSTEDIKKHRNSVEHKVKSARRIKPSKLIKTCKLCGEICQDILKLKEHREKMHPKDKSVCNYCGESFTLPQDLGHHVRHKICQASTSKSFTKTPIKVNIVSIPHPGTKSSNQEEQSEVPLKQINKEMHVLNFEPETEHAEIKESSVTVNEISIELEPQNMYYCDKCGYSIDIEAELIYHNILHTLGEIKNDEKIPCPKCDKKFTKISLRYHLRKHTNERFYKCNLCSSTFFRKHNLNTHVQNRHKSELRKHEDNDDRNEAAGFQCDTCGKVFHKKYNLRQHINTHSKRDTQFKCTEEFCIFVGRNRSDLKAHLSLHFTDATYKCNFEGCNYAGKTLNYLKKHAKRHSPAVQEHSCRTCNFKTRLPGHLRRHIRIHTGEKPYKCRHCEYSCSNLENLRKHVLTTSLHPEESLYECKLCDPSSRFQTNFQKELKIHKVVEHSQQNNAN